MFLILIIYCNKWLSPEEFRYGGRFQFVFGLFVCLFFVGGGGGGCLEEDGAFATMKSDDCYCLLALIAFHQACQQDIK